MKFLTRLLCFYCIFYNIALNHQALCFSEKIDDNIKEKARKSNINRLVGDGSKLKQMQTIDVSKLTVKTLMEMKVALSTIIDKRLKLQNKRQTKQSIKKSINKKLTESSLVKIGTAKKIHNINIQRINDLDFNGLKKLDTMLHQIILKRLNNFDTDSNIIFPNKIQVEKKSLHRQLLKNNLNPIYDSKKFPELEKSQLCGYNFDLMPVKIVNSDYDGGENMISEVKLNTLTKKAIKSVCDDD
jgi:hypothetical protein